MPGWFASFADLRVAGVSLTEWMMYHRKQRGVML